MINGKKTVSFGDSNYDDFTKHKDTDRKEANIKRHAKEDWSKSNIASPAWMSRYTLWEKPTLIKSIKMLNVFGNSC